MKQKQSQKVIVNINQAKAKRRKRAKKAKARTQLPTQPFYSPMPQPVIRYYDNQLPQRNITYQPAPVQAPKILSGLIPETEYAQPIRAERKPIKVPTPLAETEHVLLREEEPVSFGGEEAPSARDVIEEQGNAPARLEGEQPAPEQPAEEQLQKKKKKEKREIPAEFVPTFTLPFPLPPSEPPYYAQAEEPDELQKERKPRAVDPPWYKTVKAEFRRANEQQKQYDIDETKLTESEAKRAFDRRKKNYIASIGQNTSGFSYVTPPVPVIEASGGGFSFVGK